MKGHDKNRDPLYLLHWNVTNLYRCPMSGKLQIDCVEWLKRHLKLTQINENSIKYYNEDKNIGYFLKVGVKYREQLHNYTMIYLFTRKNEG